MIWRTAVLQKCSFSAWHSNVHVRKSFRFDFDHVLEKAPTCVPLAWLQFLDAHAISANAIQFMNCAIQHHSPSSHFDVFSWEMCFVSRSFNCRGADYTYWSISPVSASSCLNFADAFFFPGCGVVGLHFGNAYIRLCLTQSAKTLNMPLVNLHK